MMTFPILHVFICPEASFMADEYAEGNVSASWARAFPVSPIVPELTSVHGDATLTATQISKNAMPTFIIQDSRTMTLSWLFLVIIAVGYYIYDKSSYLCRFS
jgi:hypothetical protein